jgi:hypothetical protein
MKFTKQSKFIIASLALFAMLFATTPRARAGDNSWSVLSLNEQAAWGFTHALTLYATNCTGNVTNAANGTYNTLFPKLNDGTVNFPAGTRVRNFGIYIDKAFSTGADTAIALNIGDSTVTNRFVSAAAIGTNAGTGVLETNLSTGLIGFNAGKWIEVDTGTSRTYTVPTNLTFHLLGAGLTANGMTALASGKIIIFGNFAPLNDLVK